MDLKGTKTEQNLKDAFTAEARAMTRYMLYAGAARQDGYEQIAAIFEEIAGNEREHAEIWLKQLSSGTMPATQENLESASNGEHSEHAEMYPGYAETARQEGFEDLAKLFDQVGAIEQAHEERYSKLLGSVKNGEVFTKSHAVEWQCRNCGNIVSGPDAPMICPVCGHPQAYYQLKPENG